jgi:hypothetical protein
MLSAEEFRTTKLPGKSGFLLKMSPNGGWEMGGIHIWRELLV